MTFPRFLNLEDTASNDRLTQLFAVVGKDVALQIIENWHGVRLYIPKKSGENQKLAKVIGLHAATALSEQFGGLWVDIPLARSWRCQIYADRGWRVPEISLALGVTKGTVTRILSKLRQAREKSVPPFDFELARATNFVGADAR